jgi:hypothetical protein
MFLCIMRKSCFREDLFPIPIKRLSFQINTNVWKYFYKISTDGGKIISPSGEKKKRKKKEKK